MSESRNLRRVDEISGSSMRDQRGTDLPGGSHLGSGISQPGAIWRQAGGTRSRETVVMEPFHGSHPAQSPFLRSQILCLTCSLQLAYDGSNLLECLLNRRYFGFRVTVKVQSTPHGASFCPNLVNKALKGQEKWVVRCKMFFSQMFLRLVRMRYRQRLIQVVPTLYT